MHPKAASDPYVLSLHPYRAPMSLSKEMPKPFRPSRPSSTARDLSVCPGGSGGPVPSQVGTGLTWLLCPTGAALGPLLAGLISPTGWNNVFYMLIAADVLACLVGVSLQDSFLCPGCHSSLLAACSLVEGTDGSQEASRHRANCKGLYWLLVFSAFTGMG